MTTRGDLRGFLARTTAVESRHAPTGGPRVRWPGWAAHLVDHRGGIGTCPECTAIADTIHLAELVDGPEWAEVPSPERPALDVLKARRWPAVCPSPSSRPDPGPLVADDRENATEPTDLLDALRWNDDRAALAAEMTEPRRAAEALAHRHALRRARHRF